MSNRVLQISIFVFIAVLVALLIKAPHLSNSAADN